MTTNVLIRAHCADDIQVEIEEWEPETGSTFTYLKNGEEHETYVYGDKSVAISEIPLEGDAP